MNNMTHNERINLEIVNVRNEAFKRKFEALIFIARGDGNKLGVHENNTYVSWNYLQGINRYYNGETRDKTIEFLYENIIEFREFYKILFKSMNHNIYVNEIAQIIANNKAIINLWCDGINVLKKTYKDDENTILKLNHIYNILNHIHKKSV